jgi:hypothetical protein
MTKLTRQQAQSYASRWTLVREAEVAELRFTPMETKFKQLAALMASRDAFGSDPDREEQIREVRERWARVRQALSG